MGLWYRRSTENARWRTGAVSLRHTRPQRGSLSPGVEIFFLYSVDDDDDDDEEEEDEEDDGVGRLLRRCWLYGMPRCAER
jgi:hypothetical protein